MVKKIDKTNAILGEMQSFYRYLYTSKTFPMKKLKTLWIGQFAKN